MKKHISTIAAVMVAVFAAAGGAFAQTTTDATTTATTTTTTTATTASTSTAPSGTSLGVTLNATPSLRPGTQDALLALITLQAGTGNSIQTSSLPISISFGGGLNASLLSDCRVRNVTNLASPLNNSQGIVSGTNTFNLTSPLTIDAGRTTTLALTCDIAANAPTGGTIALSLQPSSLPATVSGSNTTVTPIVGQGINGGTGPTGGTVTLSTAAPAPTPTVPGAPNTGAGGSSMAYGVILAVSAMVAAGGLYLLRRRRAY